MPANCHFPGSHLKHLLLALVLGTLLMVDAAAADICGYPAKGNLVVTRNGQVVATFRVGLAENPSQHRQGLMGCQNLDSGTGLLFIYPDARRRTFWMKDTPLELAILFASSNGRIEAIEEGHPFSTHHIQSPDGIQFVLEIQLANVDDIRVGDRMTLRLVPE